jgi:alpha-tubulin suppressor-like RCC1 family protein
MVHGGFDPASIGANVNDTIRVDIVTNADTAHAQLVVAARRRPRIVRTDPPPGGRDVPLNATIVVVFSEPVDAASLSAGVALLRDTTSVAGTVAFADSQHIRVAFRPTDQLAPLTTYRLVVTQSIRDLNGLTLDSPAAVSFTTGTSIAPSLMSLSPGNALAGGPAFTLSVTGLHFERTSVVNFDGVSEPTTFIDSTHLTAAIPSGAIALPKTVDVTVTNSGNATSAPLNFTINGASPAPVLDSIRPGVVTAGDAAFTLTVFGKNFLAKSTVNFGGSPQPTTYVSVTQLTAVIPATAISSAGNAFVSVTNPPGVGGGTSAQISFMIVPSIVPAASPYAVRPGDVVVGGPAFTLTVLGYYFVPTSVVNLGGTPYPTTYVSDGQLNVAIPASAIATADSAAVTVTNPGPNSASADTLYLSIHAPLAISGFASISVGDMHTCALTAAGDAYCWGLGSYGELAYGLSTTNRTTPTPVLPYQGQPTLTFASVSAKYAHTCGITLAGEAYCWGYGPVNGGSGTYAHPFQLGTGTGYAMVSAGGSDTSGQSFSCVVTTAGAAQCAGANSIHQLGDGTTLQKLYLVPVLGGLPFSTVSAGGEQRPSIGVAYSGPPHACGITTTGAAYCWGDNESGQLGDSSELERLTPVAVAGGFTFDSISAGGAHTCALTSAGAAYCWGSNTAGQIGNGTDAIWQSPVPVRGGLTFTSISAGGDHTCGVTTSGAAYCWGDNETGQLGDGTYNSQNTPTPVAGGLSFASISAGAVNTCGITTAGAAYCWGDNTNGQLGIGATTGYGGGGRGSNVPVKVLGQP